MISAYVSLLVIILFLMIFTFFVSQIFNENILADIVWGFGFVIISLYTFFIYGSFLERQILVTLLVVIWGLRLSLYIIYRLKTGSKGFRYKNLRRHWGKTFVLKSFFYIFIFEGLLMLLVSLPIAAVNYYDSGSLNWLDNVGLTVWSFGFVMECLADFQMIRFKNNPQKQKNIYTEGLWKYSRHPNYFGEAAMWWGIFIIALSVPYGYFTLIGPAIVTFLVLYFSGIPMLEKRFEDDPEYQRYAGKTSKFLPKLPK